MMELSDSDRIKVFQIFHQFLQNEYVFYKGLGNYSLLWRKKIKPIFEVWLNQDWSRFNQMKIDRVMNFYRNELGIKLVIHNDGIKFEILKFLVEEN